VKVRFFPVPVILTLEKSIAPRSLKPARPVTDLSHDVSVAPSPYEMMVSRGWMRWALGHRRITK
jgi:hypothetical protein